MTPARITEPAVGAWVWASGNHVCTGKSGTFTAKAMANDAKSHRAVVLAISCDSAMVTRSKVSWPVARWCTQAVATTPTSMNADPNMVKRKNLVARSEEHTSELQSL